MKWNSIAGIGVTAIAALIAGQAALAQEGGTQLAREQRAAYDKAIAGKTIAFLPQALGIPVQDEWNRVLAQEAAAHGVNYVVRDPNLNPTIMSQALTALIDEKPDVLIVQNPSVTLLANELRRAEEAGIYVIQINLASNYRSSSYVGVDWREIGHKLAEEVVKDCGTGSGKSGKVQLVQGELGAAASVEQSAGIAEVFKKDPAIQVVSDQAAMWDANNAFNITTTVLQQHPDLCASIGFWNIMHSGAGKAIANAGLQDKVKIYSSGSGAQVDCDLVDNKTITRQLTYLATDQAHQLFMAAQTLLQLGQPPASMNLQYYTRLDWLDATNSKGACYAAK